MAEDPTQVDGKVLVGKSGKTFQYLNLPFGNRHGLVTGRPAPARR